MRRGISNPELDSQQNNHTGKSKTETDCKKIGFYFKLSMLGSDSSFCQCIDAEIIIHPYSQS